MGTIKTAKQLKDGSQILKLSASRTDVYKKCKRKYYYTYVEKLPKKHWDHFDLGTLVHGVLEKFHENFRNDSQRPEKIKTLMSKCFKEQVTSMQTQHKIKSEIIHEAKQLLLGYLNRISEKGLGSTIEGIEDHFNIELGEVQVQNRKGDFEPVMVGIQGYIDRMDKDPDGIWHIKDYKTSKSAKYMKPFQLETYGIPLLEKYPETERFRGSYIMLRLDGAPISYDFNREDVERVKKELVEQAKLILEEEKWSASPSPLCDWCDFKTTCQNSW